MWQDALKRCGLPVDGGELFEIWLNGREANGAGEPETATETADGVELTWIEAGIELRARISTDAETSVVRLSGGMKNVGGAPVTLTRANWRFTLAERQYSLYTQAGGWSRENRGGWHSFDAGEMAISSEWGRTTLSAAPLMALRDESCGRMTAMHLIPCGDWRMSLQNRCDNKAYLRIGASERLCVELKPGAG